MTHTRRSSVRASGAVAVAITIAAALGACGTTEGGEQEPAQTPAPPVNAAAQQTQPAAGPAVAPAPPPLPAGCPDPSAWSNLQLAQFAVVPGFDGNGGWPSWLGAGTSGAFIPHGSAGFARGDFADRLPESPRPFIAVDYEGGQVMDLAGLIGVAPSARAQAMTMSPEQVRQLANERGGAMRHYGITVDFAPVLDLDLGSPIVGDRSFGSDPTTVATYATAWAQGLHDGGVIPVLKHFPGHGSARGDSHKGLVVTDAWDVLKNRDVPVYTEVLKGSGPAMVMMGHLVVPGLSTDPESPTSVDPQAYRALRDTTGFTGPVITDDLAAMKAITDRLPVSEAVVSAIHAGADLALITDSAGYPGSVESLATWADSNPGYRQQLINSALRVMPLTPCATG